MTTNATLLDNDILLFLKEQQIGIMVSLDGPKNIHDAQCPTKKGKGSYDIVFTNISNALKTLDHIEVRCTMTHPIPDIKELQKFYEGLGFSRIVMEPAINNEENATEVDFQLDDILKMLEIERKELPNILDAMFGEKRPSGFNYDRELYMISSANLPEQPHAIRCYAGCNSVCIDTDGNIYPCAKFSGSLPWSRGNVKDGINHKDFLLIWQNFARSLAHSCRACWAYSSCFKLCIGEYAKSNGTFSEKCFIRCLRQKAALENAIYLYTKYQERKNQIN